MAPSCGLVARGHWKKDRNSGDQESLCLGPGSSDSGESLLCLHLPCDQAQALSFCGRVRRGGALGPSSSNRGARAPFLWADVARCSGQAPARRRSGPQLGPGWAI